MMNALVFAFIFIALAIGYGLGRFTLSNKNSPFSKRYASYNKSYFESLTFLLNEETDEAIDRFIVDMDVNEQTLEVHLALGALLRRKGELARAVKVHENLLAKDLDEKKRDLVQLELAEDYIQSGLLDRTENLLKKIVDENPVDVKLRNSALEKLIEVYQSTSEWLLAIDIADQLTEKKFSEKSDRWKISQSHYACELAEIALNNKDDTEAIKWIRAALRYNKKSVRASLIQAAMESKAGEEAKAISTLKNIFAQDIEFASEAIEPLENLFNKLELADDFVSLLWKYLTQTQNAFALSVLFRLAVEREGFAAAVDYIRPLLPKYPRLAPALTLVQTLDAKQCKKLEGSLRPALEALLDNNKSYECERCGFRGSEMHWLCPSCKSWESLKQR